jgi:membrane protease YdiL (CAAX protease family)
MQSFAGFLKRHSLVIGIVLMFAFTWPIDLSSAGLMPFRVPFMLYLFLGWGFGLAALLMTWVTLGWTAVVALYKRYLIWRVGWKWYLALLIVPALDLLGLALNAALTRTPIDFSHVMADDIRPGSITRMGFLLPFLLFDAVTNGEEIGWRGFSLPRLQARYSALTASLILGVIWGFWHLPKFITHWDTAYFAVFMVDIIAKSVLLAWLYNNTGGSLLMVTLFHAATNTSGVFLPAGSTVSNENMTAYLITSLLEVAAVVVIAATAGAANLSRTRRKQVQV